MNWIKSPPLLEPAETGFHHSAKSAHTRYCDWLLKQKTKDYAIYVASGSNPLEIQNYPDLVEDLRNFQ
jgi:hypothetical protein